MTKEKCYVLLLMGNKSKVKGGKFDLEDGIIYYGFRGRKTAVIPFDVKGVPYKRNRLLFAVDVAKSMAVSVGEGVEIDSAEVDKMQSKLDLLMRNKFWRFVGGRYMGLVETVIMLGAGYGFLRLVELLITRMFG